MDSWWSQAQRLLADGRARVDAALERWLPATSELPVRVHESMRYSTLAPGKRLRPVLALAVCETMGGREESILPSACALEMIHAFSLIHDDLPAMDDDDLRRGRPTNHVRFGEATAILAGDALCSLAFEVIAVHTPDPSAVADLVRELAVAVGTQGMIGGQIMDLENEGQPPRLDLVREIHRRKTAALLRAACRLGARAADASSADTAALSRFGEALGLAFQITDDILDETSTAAELGKGTKKDLERGKLTWPACVGLDASRQAASDHVEEAVLAIRHIDNSGSLESLARFVVSRNT